MKKFITLLVAVLSAFTAVFAAGCGDDQASISVYAPDGAPALSIAKFINDGAAFGTDKTFDYHVVSATEINNAIITEKAATSSSKSASIPNSSLNSLLAAVAKYSPASTCPPAE